MLKKLKNHGTFNALKVKDTRLVLCFLQIKSLVECFMYGLAVAAALDDERHK